MLLRRWYGSWYERLSPSAFGRRVQRGVRERLTSAGWRHSPRPTTGSCLQWSFSMLTAQVSSVEPACGERRAGRRMASQRSPGRSRVCLPIGHGPWVGSLAVRHSKQAQEGAQAASDRAPHSRQPFRIGVAARPGSPVVAGGDHI